MKIAISAESTIDLTKELIAKYNLKILPYQITLGDEVKYDGEISSQEIIDFVTKTGKLPKTSAINEFTFQEYFNELLKEYDAVIHFTLSSGISCTCSNAMRAVENMPNVYVIDTKSLSTGIALQAIYATELLEQGLSAKEIYEKCLKRVSSVQASFELTRLDYLHKGGRCSSLAFFGANLLKLRPQILVTKEGTMVAGKKYRGSYEHVVKNYCQDTLEKFNTPDLKRAFITYTTAPESVVNIAREYLKEAGFEEIIETKAGATITTYCGENCLGILYINDGNEQK